MNANIFGPGVVIGVVAGVVVFSLLVVSFSVAILAALYARKLRKVRDRRRAVVFTQYGIHGMLKATEMLGVGEGMRFDNQNQVVKLILFKTQRLVTLICS